MGTDMEMYVRPMTLFNSEKFWGYANEPIPKKPGPKDSVGKTHDVWGEFTREERAEITNLRILYNQLLNKTLQLMNVERFEQLPDDFPTQETWIRQQLLDRRKRKETD
jgi:hypothetical protein